MSTNTTDALRALGREGVLSADDATQLVDTLRLWHGLQGMLSLTVEEEMTAAREAEMSDALKASLAAIGETSSFEQLEDKVRALADQIYGIFKRLIEEPAGELPPAPAD